MAADWDALLQEIDQHLLQGSQPEVLLPLVTSAVQVGSNRSPVTRRLDSLRRELERHCQEQNNLKRILLVTEAIAADGGAAFQSLRAEVQRQLAHEAELENLFPLIEAIGAEADAGKLPDAEALRGLAIATHLARTINSPEARKRVWPVVVRLALLAGCDARKLVATHTDLEWTILSERCRKPIETSPVTDGALKLPDDPDLKWLWFLLFENARKPDGQRADEIEIARREWPKSEREAKANLNKLQQMRRRDSVSDWNPNR